ncbi:hypothetical protein [Paenibacillus sp. CMAA1364]
MKPTFVPHSDYQYFVLQQIRSYGGPGMVLLHKDWVNIMKRTPIYAILSGFAFDDLPGVGTFYDFFKRL